MVKRKVAVHLSHTIAAERPSKLRIRLEKKKSNTIFFKYGYL